MLIVAAYLLAFYGALPFALWTVGGRVDALLHLPPLRGGFPRIAGGVAAAVGVAWMAWAMWLMWRRGAGLPISHLPPKRLTRAGPYAVMRHPVYVGYFVAFVGCGVVAGSLGRSVGAGALLALGSALYALGFEETRLVRRFGEEYVAYRDVTPAFGLRWRWRR